MTVGFEVEAFGLGYEEVLRAQEADGIFDVSYWQPDRSTGPRVKKSFELNSRPVRSLSEARERLRLIHACLVRHGARFTDTCGFHVHVGNLYDTPEPEAPRDMSDYPRWHTALQFWRMNVAQIAREGRELLVAAAIIDWMLCNTQTRFLEAAYGPDWEKDRRWLKRAQFARPDTWAYLRAVIERRTVYNDRYHALNFVDSHAAAEFRLFPAVEDVEAMERWLTMAVEWVERVLLDKKVQRLGKWIGARMRDPQADVRPHPSVRHYARLMTEVW